MMKILSILLGIVAVIGVLIFSGLFFVVDETQQVVITRFGEPMGQPVKSAGLYFKVPFMDKANYFDKRIMPWEGDADEITTLDLRHIWVDTIARWKIVDPLKFMQSVGNETGAQARLDDIIDAATRDAISGQALVESIRNSNRLIHDVDKSNELAGKTGAITTDNLEKIKVGRDQITREILERSLVIIPNYGIELVDVRIKRINYVEKVQRKVYERMISERKRAATEFRSEGQGKKAEIEGQMTKELRDIRSQAYKAAQEIKGKADAEAIKIYADAYNKDPEFYSFIKTLETYKDTINQGSTFILTTDNEFYKYLRSVKEQPGSIP